MPTTKEQVPSDLREFLDADNIAEGFMHQGDFDVYDDDSYTEEGKVKWDGELSNCNGWKAVEVDHYGGEGQGDTYYTVFSFEKNGEKIFIRFDGWYESHNGSEFNDYRIVTPKQKTITVYE